MTSESVNESTTTPQEGSPAVEQAEKQVLGETNYQKVEVVHRFADSHPYIHPLLLGVVALIIIGVLFFLTKRMRKGGETTSKL